LEQSTYRTETLNSDTLNVEKFKESNLEIKMTFNDLFFGYKVFDNFQLKTGYRKLFIYYKGSKKWISIPKIKDSSRLFYRDFK